MENKQYCPLNAATDEVLHCCREKCAWWDEDAQACSVLVIVKAMRKVTRNGR